MTDTVEIYKDDAGEYRWRRVSENGRIVATSGEGYVDHYGAADAAARENADADVSDKTR